MKACLFFFPFLLLFAACEKQADGRITLNTGTLCADTTSQPPFLTEPPQMVYFLNNTTGFIGGSQGGLYKTTDGGINWISETSGITLPIYSIWFLNDETGFAAGGTSGCFSTGCTVESSFILKTTNGGSTWTRVYTPTVKTEVRSLCFVNETTGFAVTGTTILKTTDGGNTWHEHTMTNLPTTMMEVQFSDLNTGYIACLSDIVVKTEDGGTTWQVQHPRNNDPTAGYTSLSVTDGAIYLGGGKEIVKSTDGGASWHVLHPSPSDIYAIHFINASTGYALGRGIYPGSEFDYSRGAFYCTHDGGNSWEGTDNIDQPGYFINASFPSDSVGYAFQGNRLLRLSLQ